MPLVADAVRAAKLVASRLLLGLVALAACRAASGAEPDHAAWSVLQVARSGYSIAALASHASGAPGLRYGVALFPGNPGILQLEERDGVPRFDMTGNFLVRSRERWLDGETLVLVVDAPSDQWSSFGQTFRATERYGADLAALLHEAGRRYGVSDWTLVGTSEGAVSAFHAARLNPALVRRLILTASLFLANRNGPGLSDVDPGAVRIPLLWVHHADDPCRYTPYRSARAFAERSRAPLLTVRGGGPFAGEPCRARSAHGFAGMEERTVAAMAAWIRTGKAPAEIGP